MKSIDQNALFLQQLYEIVSPELTFSSCYSNFVWLFQVIFVTPVFLVDFQPIHIHSNWTYRGDAAGSLLSRVCLPSVTAHQPVEVKTPDTFTLANDP